jgi:regulator of RNase E activity RraA
VDLHGAVRVGGVTIHPGDLIHADANGVTTIPLEIASEVAQAAAEFVAAESIVLDYLKSGPDAAAFREARQGMLAAIAALGKRVRGKSRE